MKLKILILGFSQIKRDQRILRQIRFLQEHYRLTILGHGEYPVEGVDFIKIEENHKSQSDKAWGAFQLLTHQFERYYWQQPRVQDLLQKASTLSFDGILANDIDTLPLALNLANGKPVIYDAHEYFPSEFDNSFTWRVFYKKFKTYLCKRYMTGLPNVMTVSQGIADAYAREFKVSPTVVTNACHRYALNPHSNNDKLEIVYHGGADPSRQVEQVIALMDLLDDRFRLNLILQPIASHPDYYHKMKKLAESRSNIVMHEPVPIEKIVPHIHQFDIGLHLLPPTSFNNMHALPNRFAEFIQARLAIAVGPSAEMGRIVQQAACGIVSKDFSIQAMADKLNALTKKQVDAYKTKTHALADTYCAEHNQNLIVDVMGRAFE